MLLPLCRLALDETFLSRPASESHTLSHDNSQEEEEEKEEDYKDLVSSQVRASFIIRNSVKKRSHLIRMMQQQEAVADKPHDRTKF